MPSLRPRFTRGCGCWPAERPGGHGSLRHQRDPASPVAGGTARRVYRRHGKNLHSRCLFRAARRPLHRGRLRCSTISATLLAPPPACLGETTARRVRESPGHFGSSPAQCGRCRAQVAISAATSARDSLPLAQSPHAIRLRYEDGDASSLRSADAGPEGGQAAPRRPCQTQRALFLDRPGRTWLQQPRCHDRNFTTC